MSYHKREEETDPTTGLVNTEGSELFHSNIFRLQIGELLSEVKFDFAKTKVLNEKLHKLKETLDNIPEKNIALNQIKDLKVPVHNSNLEKLSFTFVKPENIYIIGSFLLHTICSPFQNIDLVVNIPKKCLREKDVRNHLYTDKRMIYLSVIASHLDKLPEYKGKLYFKYFAGDHHKPILCFKHQYGKSKKKEFEIRIHTSISENTFKLSRLLPSKNNLRFPNEPNDDNNKETLSLPPTPNYNNRIAEDIYYLQHLQILHEHASVCPSLTDAIILFKVWLRQRGLDEQVDGFTGFHISMLFVYLFINRKVNKTMSSFQLFKILLSFIANNNDLINDGISLCNDKPELVDEFKGKFEVNLIDPSGRVNLTSRVSKVCFEELQYEAKLSLEFFKEDTLTSTGNFDALFLTSVPLYLKFDNYLQISPLPQLNEKNKEEFANQLRDLNWSVIQTRKICEILKKGLSLRANLIATRKSHPKEWKFGESPKSHSESLIIGILLKDPENSHKIVEPGPPAEDSDASSSFREFWGEKAELWRFKDGSILEAVRWDITFEKRHLVVKTIVLYLLSLHLGIPSSSVTYFADQLDTLLESKDLIKKSKAKNNEKTSEIVPENAPLNYKLISAFEELSKYILGLDNLPLRVKNVRGAHSSFSYTSPITITPHSLLLKKRSKEVSSSLYIEPIPVVINFESSNRWPDKLEAIRVLKGAFYIKIGEALEGLSSKFIQTHSTYDYLDVFHKGFAFRIFIRLEKEIQQVDKEEGGEAAESLRSLVTYLPQHILLMKAVNNRFPLFSPTVRLAKRWIYSHLFSSSIKDEAVELLVAYLFLHSKPFAEIRSQFIGFVRFLYFLSTCDFENTPIIVNLDNDDVFTDEVLQEVHRKFQFRRNSPVSGAPLFIVTSKDLESKRWTSQFPNKIYLKRISDFAGHCLNMIKSHIQMSPSLDLASFSSWKAWKSLFSTPYSDYDLLIKLNSSVVPFIRYKIPDPSPNRFFLSNSDEKDIVGEKRSRKTMLSLQVPLYKNLQQNISNDKIYVGLNSVKLLIDELQSHFKNNALFFYGECGVDIIGIVWKPAAFLPKPMRPLDLHYAIPLSGEQKAKTVIKNIFDIITDIKKIGEGVIEDVAIVVGSDKL